MPTFKTVKKICMEAFQLAAFSTPIFVAGQRLATKECSNGTEACPPTATDPTPYWLFISAIIAYVAGITLLIWIPIKLFLTWKKLYRPYEGLWFPGNVLYLIFSYIPCVIFVLVGHEVCNQQQYCFDLFRGGPIETMIIMMVVTDWSEKIRYIKLRSSDDSMRSKKYPYADYNGNKRSRSLGFSSPSTDDVIASVSRRSSISQRSLLYSGGRNGSVRQKAARYLKWKDARPENLLRDLMLAYDTRLILGLSLLDSDGSSLIFQTAWVYPIYILSTLSLMPLIFSPNSEFRSSITVLLQDIPFFILRLAILANFGSYLVLQTSMLFLLKNFFATFAFFYFNVVLPWRHTNKKTREYELEQIEGDKAITNSVGVSRTEVTTISASPYAETSHHDHAANGIANPGYHSRRYHDDHNRERHYSTREMDEFSDDPADEYEDDLYPTHRRMQPSEPQIARLERNASPQYVTYHQSPRNQAVIARNDETRESRKSIPPPRQESSSQRGEINYDTLNDPGSFLYSKNVRLERRSTKPKLVNINFENSQKQPSSPKLQTTAQLDSSRANQQRSDPRPQPTTTYEDSANGDVVQRNTESQQYSTTPPIAVEATHSVIGGNRKESRRKAPPPPTSRNSQRQDSSEVLPQPPAALLLNESDATGASEAPLPPAPLPNNSNKTGANEATSSRVVMDRQDSLYTPALARQLADEVIGRSSRKEEKEVLDALDEVVQNHGKSMINSQSTTPKSTLSAQVANGVPINDDDYDARL